MFLISYLYWINIITFVAYAMDKRYAFLGSERISEKILLSFSGIGGSIGAGMAMLLFKHKTKHRKFIAVVSISLFLWLCASGLYLSLGQ